MSEPFFSAERPCPYPTDWQVACPSCSEQVACEMDEDISGSFSKSDRDGDPVVNCDCGCFFIPSDVSVVPTPATRSGGYREGFAAAIEQAAAVVDAGAADFERQATAAPYGQAHDALLMASDALELTADAVRCLVASAEGDAE